jgi:sec-independent protein translocase protein TatC
MSAIAERRTVPYPTAVGTWSRVLVGAVAAVGAAARDMSFIEHLEELRRRVLWSVVCLGVAFGGCWMFATDLYNLASAPIRANSAVTLSVSRPQDIVSLNVTVTLVASLFVSAPFILLQAWMFISPGLYAHERRYAIPFVLFGSLLFLTGGAFGYFVAFPAALAFLLDWIVDAGLVPIIDASEYFNLFFTIIVALGVSFQIPSAIYVLSRLGLVSATLLLRKLQYAVFAAVVIAAVITPSPDIGNMFIIAGPMILLYTLGIAVAWIFGAPRRPARP